MPGFRLHLKTIVRLSLVLELGSWSCAVNSSVCDSLVGFDNDYDSVGAG